MTGCGSAVPVVTLAPRPAIPESLRTLPPAPPVPSAGADDRTIAKYIADLWDHDAHAVAVHGALIAIFSGH